MPLPPRIPKTDFPPKRAEPRQAGMSRKHLAFLRRLDCPIYPGERPIQVHHLLRADKRRGLGRRAADKYAIPLCARAHRELHETGDEEAWLASKGVDGRALAATLWRCSGDLRAGLRTVFRAKGTNRQILCGGDDH